MSRLATPSPAAAAVLVAVGRLGPWASDGDLAAETRLPASFMGNYLAELRRCGLIETVRARQIIVLGPAPDTAAPAAPDLAAPDLAPPLSITAPQPVPAGRALNGLQRRLLDAIGQLGGRARNRDLAAHLNTSAGRVSAELGTLEEAGHLRREGGHSDRRIVVTGPGADGPRQHLPATPRAERRVSAAPAADPHHGYDPRSDPRRRAGSPDSRGEQAQRHCLDCAGVFESEHRGNRICDRCKAKAKFKDGSDAAPYATAGLGP